MTEITVDLKKLKHIDDDNSYSCTHRMMSCYTLYKGWIIFFSIVCVLSGVVVSVVLSNNNTPTIPCLLYSSQTLANEVSVECLQYLWNLYCASKKPYTFSPSYSGYWNRSPRGTSAVSCSQTIDCGIGSYGNIIVYMQFCTNV